MDNMNIEKRILSTNDWGLLAILHEGLIDKFNQAKDSIKSNDFDSLNNYNNACRDILTELIVIFKNNHIDKEFGQNLRELYLYLNKLITKGQIKHDIEYYNNAIDITIPLLEAFKEKETEEIGRVVSGLTYGSKDLKVHNTKSSRTFEG